MKKSHFFLLGFAILFAACGKDDDNGNGTNTEKLTDGQWKVTASTGTFDLIGTQQTVDIYALLDACEKDNLAQFKSDGTLVADEGATKCDPSDPQQENGTWQFNTDETRLVVAGADYSFDAEILELTNSKLRVKYVTNFNGTSTTTETTFEKI